MAHDNLLFMVRFAPGTITTRRNQMRPLPAKCRTLFLTLFAVTCAAMTAARMPRRCRPRIRSRSPRPSSTLHAQLYKPDGDGPFPTVIALHGCGGLGGHSEPVLPRYRDWVEQLLKAGHAVVLPDSYGSRELGPQCRVKERRVLARRERVADIVATRQWLAQQAMGGAGSRQPDGMGQRRQRPVVGGAAASRGAMTGRISARRSRSIRTAGFPPASAGARGCRRCC